LILRFSAAAQATFVAESHDKRAPLPTGIDWLAQPVSGAGWIVILLGRSKVESTLA